MTKQMAVKAKDLQDGDVILQRPKDTVPMYRGTVTDIRDSADCAGVWVSWNGGQHRSWWENDEVFTVER